MTAWMRRWQLMGILTVLTAAVGCNLKTIPYFLFPQDNGHPPDCEALDNLKKETKLVFLTNLGSDTGPDFLRADRDLTELLVHALRKRYAETKTKIVIISPSQVENFKERNPSWQTKSMVEIGKAFHADFVANIDLDRMSLYLPNSWNEMFQGQSEISVTVFDVKKPEEHVFRRSLTYTFPPNGPQPVIENPNPAQFRAEFLAHMARELSRYFASYTMDEKYACN